MPTCDYCGFIVPDPCYSFKQMAQRSCPVLTVPIESNPQKEMMLFHAWNGHCVRSVFKVAINEGGDWELFKAHTMVMPDGSTWDAVNGWRCTAPAPGSQPSSEGQPSRGAKPREPVGPPLEAPAPKVSQESIEVTRGNLKNSHWDIWKKGYVPPPAPWVPENYIRDLVKAAQPAPHVTLGQINIDTPGQTYYADLEKKSDPINHPHHYARWAIEPIEFISLNKLPAWLANVIKYAMRYDAKDGLKDLYKARSYLDMEIRRLEGVERFWEVPVAEERRLNAA